MDVRLSLSKFSDKIARLWLLILFFSLGCYWHEVSIGIFAVYRNFIISVLFKKPYFEFLI